MMKQPKKPRKKNAEAESKAAAPVQAPVQETVENEKLEETSEQEIGDDDIVVDPETYLQLQLSTADNEIALAELKVAEAKLEVAKQKQQRQQIIIDFNVDQLKKRKEDSLKGEGKTGQNTTPPNRKTRRQRNKKKN